MKVLLISYEFAEPIFSGNGTLSRSVANGLYSLCSSFVVVSARPQGSVEKFPFENREGRRGYTVEVPSWFRLDKESEWLIFATKTAQQLGATLREYSPDVVLCVDWTGIGTYLELQKVGTFSKQHVPVYLNFRVYYASTGVSEQDAQFYLEKEAEACRLTKLTVCLCNNDAKLLRKITSNEVVVVNPALRHSIEEESRIHSAVQDKSDRMYLLCCVRLSPEKNCALFVDVVEELAKNHFFQKHNIIPFLCGATCDKEYAAHLVQRLKTAFPPVVICHFLTPTDLANTFKKTLLNLHPAPYEPYGLTVVEAAAFSVPSLVHHPKDAPDLEEGELVGVTDLLKPTQKEILTVDMRDVSATANKVRFLLENREILDEIGRNAFRKCLSWTETQYGQTLFKHLPIPQIQK